MRSFFGEFKIQWEQFLREYQFVKQTDWSYEREYRIVSGKKRHETDLYSDYLFHPEDLRGVILGAKIEADHESSLRRLVSERYPYAVLYRAHVDYGSRSITYAPAALRIVAADKAAQRSDPAAGLQPCGLAAELKPYAAAQS